jgi:hypothetical protein
MAIDQQLIVDLAINGSAPSFDVPLPSMSVAAGDFVQNDAAFIDNAGLFATGLTDHLALDVTSINAAPARSPALAFSRTSRSEFSGLDRWAVNGCACAPSSHPRARYPPKSPGPLRQKIGWAEIFPVALRCSTDGHIPRSCNINCVAAADEGTHADFKKSKA